MNVFLTISRLKKVEIHMNSYLANYKQEFKKCSLHLAGGYEMYFCKCYCKESWVGACSDMDCLST